jgi:hypothetical protein
MESVQLELVPTEEDVDVEGVDRPQLIPNGAVEGGSGAADCSSGVTDYERLEQGDSKVSHPEEVEHRSVAGSVAGSHKKEKPAFGSKAYWKHAVKAYFKKWKGGPNPLRGKPLPLDDIFASVLISFTGILLVAVCHYKYLTITFDMPHSGSPVGMLIGSMGASSGTRLASLNSNSVLC